MSAGSGPGSEAEQHLGLPGILPKQGVGGMAIWPERPIVCTVVEETSVQVLESLYAAGRPAKVREVHGSNHADG